jgi:hypothetical protein
MAPSVRSRDGQHFNSPLGTDSLTSPSTLAQTSALQECSLSRSAWFNPAGPNHRITNQPSQGRIVRGETTWRYIAGTFDLRGPAMNPSALLPTEETLLAIKKYRLQLKSPRDHWYLVLSALGGNAAAILKASPTSYNPCEKVDTGKVTGLIYDRQGWSNPVQTGTNWDQCLM